MPILIKIIDERSKLEPILPQIKRMVGDKGILTLQEVLALQFHPGKYQEINIEHMANVMQPGQNKFNISCEYSMIKEGEKMTMQLVLNHDRITVSITMFDGVLVTRVFEGNNCYDQFLDFLKTQFDTTSAIHSSIIVTTHSDRDTKKA